MANKQTAKFPLSFHHEMISDVVRVSAFTEALRAAIGPSDIVLDAGAGVGTLSLIAAPLARHVYAIEIDARAADIAARNFAQSPHKDKITLIVGDATNVAPPEGVDVVIAELLDTALLNEPQVAVANFARTTLLRPNGVTIPCGVRNWISLAQCSYRFFDAVELRVAHYERQNLVPARTRSDDAPFYEVDFSRFVPEQVSVICLLKCTHPGIVNSVRLRSEVQLTTSLRVGTCPTLNVPICVPLHNVEQLTLRSGDELQVSVSYLHGGSMDDVVVIAERV